MVGILFGGKNSLSPSRLSCPSTDAIPPSDNTPPPPYAENGQSSSAYVTETTTTTTQVITTTTHTTTHFFSLPLWRKRTPANSTTDLTRPRMHASPSSDELGMTYSSPRPLTTLFRDKDLPPTPSPTDSREQTPITANDRSVARGEGPSRASIYDPSSPRPAAPVIAVSASHGGEPSSQPTAALARAALRLGLQPAMTNQRASPSPASETNVVSFSTSPPPEASPTRPTLTVMRRAKSFQRDANSGGESSYADILERRRTRGLSLGPLHFGADIKGKGKEKEAEPGPKPSRQKSLTRKASFWSRKRHDSQAKLPADLQLSAERTLQPSLPSLQPISPFRMDTAIPTSTSPMPESQKPLPSPGLHRRHSDRSTQNRVLLEQDITISPEHVPTESPPKRRRPRRPQTADPADTHRRHSSSYSQNISSAPLSSPSQDIAPSSSPSPSISVPNQAIVRPRSSTNPPFLQRLSINLFGSPSIPSPQPGSNFSGEQMVDSPSSSRPTSGRPSLSKSKHSLEIPRPRHEEESPENYLRRLLEAVNKAEVATVLASSPDEFHARALRAYIERFDFSSDPLDVALRRLLMDVGLPRETQQIDRVMEAFAARYMQCHRNLFTSDDHPYILAFSLIMLHTDAFNKSNKRKMTKADYVKNTRLPGVAPEVLECFYDNIVFAPFIFIEDPLDVNGQRGLLPDGTPTRRMSSFNTSSPGAGGGTGTGFLGRSAKIDPYYLITHNLLDDLRVNVEAYVPPHNPYTYQGTTGQWDDEELLRAFQTAGVVEISSAGYYPGPWFSLGVGGGPMSIGGALPSTTPAPFEAFTLRVTKVGTLRRKDQMLEGGRKPLSRKWRDWSVLLTGSQLLLSRDVSWANMIRAKAESLNGQVSMPHTSIPRPDELLSVKDSVAVYDKSYTKYENVLRLVMRDGRQVLFQAPDEKQMNEWIACINYASAFKTAGVRMRSLGMSGTDIELTGKAAAASHLRDVQARNRQAGIPRVRTWEGRPSLDLALPSRNDPKARQDFSNAKARVQRMGSVDSDQSTSPLENPSKLLKATFDQVKQDLAAGHWQSLDEGSLRSFSRPRAMSLESSLTSNSPTAPTAPAQTDYFEEVQLSSRSKIIRSKVSELESKISAAHTQLETDMRFVWNIAVLTPFQRATRERLQVAIQAMSKRIMQNRLDIEKLVCHRDVLARDLVAEERDWQRTKTLALRAATRSLQSQSQDEADLVPRMTLSVFLDDAEQTIPPSESPSASPTHSRRQSSAGESFHSALEYSSDSSDRRDASFDASRSPSTPSTPKHTAVNLSPGSGRQERGKATSLTAESSLDSSSSNHSDLRGNSHQKYITAPEMPEEQAEEWNKTRAAKRVSLVKLPSDLRMSVLFGKHEQDRATPSVPEDGSDSTNVIVAHSNGHAQASLRAPQHNNRPNAVVETVAMLDL